MSFITNLRNKPRNYGSHGYTPIPSEEPHDEEYQRKKQQIREECLQGKSVLHPSVLKIAILTSPQEYKDVVKEIINEAKDKHNAIVNQGNNDNTIGEFFKKLFENKQ